MNWSQVTHLPLPCAVYCFATTGNNLFAGTSKGIYLTTNRGTSWTEVSNGLPAISAVNCLVVSSDQPSGLILFAGTYEGIYMSTNSGINWIAVNENLPEEAIIRSLAIIDDILFAALGSVWFRSITEMITSAEDEINFIYSYKLEKNYTNPFNPSTTFNFSIPGQEHVTLKIYDILGNEIAVLVNEIKSSGEYQIEWDASFFASGVYIYRLTAGDFISTKKLMLIK